MLNYSLAVPKSGEERRRRVTREEKISDRRGEAIYRKNMFTKTRVVYRSKELSLYYESLTHRVIHRPHIPIFIIIYSSDDRIFVFYSNFTFILT